MSNHISASIRGLIAETIDYAGLFPPSQLSMAEAVENYSQYKNSRENWLLGRFVVPAQKLAEFSLYAADFYGGSIWKLSVLAGENIDKTVEVIEKFNRAHNGKAIADAVEIKAQNASEIENACANLPENLEAYFELPLVENLAEMAATLAIYGKRAKIRTGGITPEAFPSAAQIVKFMEICLAANVPFKCTAGLHHPLRCTKPLTYETDAITGAMHGFLNVFLAAAFLRQEYSTQFALEVMENTTGANFEFSDDGILFREIFLSTEQLKQTRRYITSFGSCSFTEPIDDLREIKLL